MADCLPPINATNSLRSRRNFVVSTLSNSEFAWVELEVEQNR